MSYLRRGKIPLAHKISLLFGTAVLATIAVTLVFPQLQMTALNEQVMLIQAKQIALAAYQATDLGTPRWAQAAKELAWRWPVLAREADLPPTPPVLVRADGEVGGGFQQEAIDHLQTNPHQKYYWRLQDEGRLFRFAMGVRSHRTDPHPNALRGIIDVRFPTASNARAWNIAVTALAGASGAILAILAFYVVSQRLVLTPVRSLRRVAEEVTSGNLDVRSTIDSGDEFEELSDAFNDMLIHLKSAQEEQQKINRSLDVRLEELAEANVLLFESDRLKSEFLTNVTHELRTPLVSIIGFAELLRDAGEDPKTDRKRLTRFSANILISARNLLDIINDLLDLAKIESGVLELHITEFSIESLCRDMIDFVQPLVDKQNQRLLLEIEGSLALCRSDSGKIKQILYNLMSNAIKFTPTGGSVTLCVRVVDGDRFEMQVSDTGLGIAADQLELIFDKFSQVDASQTREHEGTGLGLAITREVVRMLGGTIGVQSVPGVGSTFSVVLPYRAQTDEANKHSPRESTGLVI